MSFSSKTLVLLAALAAPSRSAEIIKFATLAPEGSTWMKVMQALDKELQVKTGGGVRFRFYPGGVSGDEKDVVRKMRIGQLHAGGLTGVGLGELAPEVRVLDAPFLVSSYAELDAVMAAVEPDLSKALEAKGYVVLGWTEVGFVQLFTAAPVKTLSDLKSVKMWVWEGDPIAESAFEAAGVHPVPLSITDVTTSLQTGLINGVYGSPLAVVALQWYARTPYIHSYPMAHASGAVLVSKKLFDKLGPAHQAALKEVSKAHLKRLNELGRTENERALETLKKEGLKLVDPAPEARKEYEAVGRKARDSLVGRLYSKQLLERVEKAAELARRAKNKKS